MSGLLFLSSDDFRVLRGVKGLILCNSIKGFSLILYYLERCEFSRNVLPIFRKLPSYVPSCRFGIINVDLNRAVVEMSKSTIDPITRVPYIVLYVDGRPYMSYKGPLESEEIHRFIFDVSEDLGKKRAAKSASMSRPAPQQQGHGQQQMMMRQQPQHLSAATSSGGLMLKPSISHGSGRAIPVYTIGVPLYGDDDTSTYLSFDKDSGYVKR
jgi:hypothetical protein